eukprot:jgi/Astpho2/4912/Aster-05841
MGPTTFLSVILAAFSLLFCSTWAFSIEEQELAVQTLAGSNWNADPEPEVNVRPLIGVMNIASSYVKFVEMAGGRVVPIEYDLPFDEMKTRFNSINGMLIPGGSADLKPGHPFYDATEYLFKLALEANDKGDYFPIQGTCLGFEMLSVIFSGNTSLLRGFDAEDYASPLYLTEDAVPSRFFGSMPKKVRRDLQEHPLAMENHGNGVYFRSYDENPKLKEFAKVLSLSTDRGDRVYVSTFEARKYPIYGTQWHPEKNAFEWSAPLRIPHTRRAVDVTTAVANFFVDEARKNFHRPSNQLDEDNMLIYNYCPEFTGKHKHEGEETDFDECFFFPEWKGKNTAAAVSSQ